MKMQSDKQRALDETRRCLLIALAYLQDGEKVPPDLRGTIANALKHHHRELNLAWSSEDAVVLMKSIDAITAVLHD